MGRGTGHGTKYPRRTDKQTKEQAHQGRNGEEPERAGRNNKAGRQGSREPNSISAQANIHIRYIFASVNIVIDSGEYASNILDVY